MAFATRVNEITAAMSAAQEAREIAEAQAAVEAANARRLAIGAMFCPVNGPVNFTDTWGAARSGGRTHVGVDMLASRARRPWPRSAARSSTAAAASAACPGTSTGTTATPTTARTSRATRTRASAGWRRHDHRLRRRLGERPWHPHLHFEVHPGGGSPVNPYPYVAEAC